MGPLPDEGRHPRITGHRDAGPLPPRPVLWITTMVNRLQYLMGEVPDPTSYTDFYEIEAIGDTYIVPLSTALAIERQLERCAVTDWLEFRDVFGARHRLPAQYVYRITESTRATRAALRELRKAILEAQGD